MESDKDLPAPDTMATDVRTFISRYLEEHRSSHIACAFDIAHGDCGPFAEDLAAEMAEHFPACAAVTRDTDDMLGECFWLPRPHGFHYAFHVYVEAWSNDGRRYYDALTPDGVPCATMLSFNAEQIRHARCWE